MNMTMNNKIFAKIFLWMFIGLMVTFGVGFYVSNNEIMLENVFKIWGVSLVEDIKRGNNKSKANILNEAKELFKSVHDSDTLIDKEKHFPN